MPCNYLKDEWLVCFQTYCSHPTVYDISPPKWSFISLSEVNICNNPIMTKRSKKTKPFWDFWKLTFLWRKKSISSGAPTLLAWGPLRGTTDLCSSTVRATESEVLFWSLSSHYISFIVYNVLAYSVSYWWGLWPQMTFLRPWSYIDPPGQVISHWNSLQHLFCTTRGGKMGGRHL